MAKYLVDVIDVSDMGVTVGNDPQELERHIHLTLGEDFSLGLELTVEGREVCDSTGEVIAVVFMVAEGDLN